MTKLKLNKNNADIYASNILQKNAWASINEGYIYIARDKGRSYWLLNNIPLNKRPKIYFNNKTKTLRIGNNKIVIKSETNYNIAKKYLELYSKNSKTFKRHVKKYNKKTKKYKGGSSTSITNYNLFRDMSVIGRSNRIPTSSRILDDPLFWGVSRISPP